MNLMLSTTLYCAIATLLPAAGAQACANLAVGATNVCERESSEGPAVIHTRLVGMFTRARLDPRALHAAGVAEAELPAIFAAGRASVAARWPALVAADARVEAARAAVERERRERELGRNPAGGGGGGGAAEAELQAARAEQGAVLAGARADVAGALGAQRAGFIERWAADAGLGGGGAATGSAVDPAADPAPGSPASGAGRSLTTEDRAAARARLSVGLEAFTRAWAAQSLAAANAAAP